MDVVEQNREQIIQLCERYKVDNLFVFGSVLTNKFHQDSDIDFLVKFKPFDLSLYFDNYMELKESLEKLVHRPIDLLEDQAIQNPILRKSIDRTKQLLYGRADRKVAA